MKDVKVKQDIISETIAIVICHCLLIPKPSLIFPLLIFSIHNSILIRCFPSCKCVRIWLKKFSNSSLTEIYRIQFSFLWLWHQFGHHSLMWTLNIEHLPTGGRVLQQHLQQYWGASGAGGQCGEAGWAFSSHQQPSTNNNPALLPFPSRTYLQQQCCSGHSSDQHDNGQLVSGQHRSGGVIATGHLLLLAFNNCNNTQQHHRDGRDGRDGSCVVDQPHRDINKTHVNTPQQQQHQQQQQQFFWKVVCSDRRRYILGPVQTRSVENVFSPKHVSFECWLGKVCWWSWLSNFSGPI